MSGPFGGKQTDGVVGGRQGGEGAGEVHAFHGLIGGVVKVEQWLDKIPVPTVYHSSECAQGNINLDHRQFMDLGLRALVKQGCRSAGLIHPISPEALRDGPRSMQIEALEGFVDACREHGVQIRNQWVHITQAGQLVSDASQEEFGHDAFHKIWGCKSRPEGLLVFPDTVVRGVLLGLAQNQVRVPGDLKLVLHRNADIPVFCPMPATWLASREQEIARALLEQVQNQLAGKTCERVMIKYHLETSA